MAKKLSKPGGQTRNYFRLQIPSHPMYVASVRDLIYNLCRLHGFSPRGAFELKVICGEALVNVILHAYEGRNDRPIFIEFFIFPEYADLRISDLGRQLPIQSDRVRDLSDYRESGLGLYLINKLSDYHFFDQNRDVGTELVIKKRIK